MAETTSRSTPDHTEEEKQVAWSYNGWLHDDEQRKEDENIKKKHLPLTWRNLVVTGVDSKAALADDIASAINPLIFFRRDSQESTTTILHSMSGQVKPGEMLLVLGRPGSGCTSFLKSVANKGSGFKSVEGEVLYGTMTPKEASSYRGAILYNSEEDIHFPTLTVAQTLSFVVKTRVPRHVRGKGTALEHVKELFHVFSNALGIHHVKDTLVGNEFVRGVSGGQRKRVSIGEVMGAQGSITCYDNATRGLDASSALEFTQALRSSADKSCATIIATLYQAGNAMFDQFDKVLVLESGRQLYYGPRSLAKEYFENLGFACPPGANIADFLTSVTVSTERQIKPGFEATVPRTAQDFESVYHKSAVAQVMALDMVDPADFEDLTTTFQEAVKEERPKGYSPLQSSYTVTLWHQILACIVRQVQVLHGDMASLILQQLSAIIQALISGSLYYNLPVTSAGTFTRTGALFYPLIFFSFCGMSEMSASFMGRSILSRHRDFGLYRPTADVIAKMLIDIPNVIFQVSIFSLIFYFMTGFQVDAGKFFTFWILVIISTLCYIATFRMIGCLFRSFDVAAQIGGLWMMIISIYAGYFVPFPRMHPWFKWLFWLNPSAYTYEALMANEFTGLDLACVGAQRVPNGDGYTSSANQVCTVAGASADGSVIIGADYISQTYQFSSSHIWRNFGIVIGWWIFYTIITAISLEIQNGHNQGKSSLLYKRGTKSSKSLQFVNDEEKAGHRLVIHYIGPVPSIKMEELNSGNSSGNSSDSATLNIPGSSDGEADAGLTRNRAVFTWDHLSYTVKVPGGELKLLDNISGWVKPGQLGALMGSSGAGKTTLLDVLAQRKDVGVIHGEILVDGRPLPANFQRSAGYCEQMDVHERTTTVKEALIFSARLRQPRGTPDSEKLSYVDEVIQLLELEELQDAIIGIPGAGLTVEQRKRVTIGVELAARPTILLFLDEPTSGLDGQSAFNVVRFLRRLTAAGQAVLCTIHQPSAVLFEAFDSLLLLAKGGQTVYFGQTGTNSSILMDYFARHGAPCNANANPAEHMIDVVSGASGGGVNWHEIWLASKEHAAVTQQLAQIKRDALAAESTVQDDPNAFATPLWTQLKVVTHRQQIALWRNPNYVWNKILFHVLSALFAGFTFWKLKDNQSDLQTRLLAVFNFLFVAVSAISQSQPLFLQNRDIFETREKKSKMYSWLAFITAQLIAEIPYLVVCGTLYFACWYFTSGLPIKASISGQIYLEMIFYEFLYTAIGQGIAAISPNAFFASLINPTLIGGFLVGFAGVLVPYSQIVVFWKYWLYWMDPFTYLTGGLLTQLLYAVDVTCTEKELAIFTPPKNQTCGDYMASFFELGAGYIVDSSSTTSCEYCAYKDGGQYAKTLNFTKRLDGWRDTGITALFCISTYAFVFAMMKLRTKKSKSAEA